MRGTIDAAALDLRDLNQSRPSSRDADQMTRTRDADGLGQPDGRRRESLRQSGTGEQRGALRRAKAGGNRTRR